MPLRYLVDYDYLKQSDELVYVVLQTQVTIANNTCANWIKHTFEFEPATIKFEFESNMNVFDVVSTTQTTEGREGWLITYKLISSEQSQEYNYQEAI